MAGHFSNVLTLILASCRRPEAPRNGGMRGDNFNHNEKVVFYCDENYQLVGQSQITCKDGSWSGVFPKCSGTPFFSAKFKGRRTVRFRIGHDTVSKQNNIS